MGSNTTPGAINFIQAGDYLHINMLDLIIVSILIFILGVAIVKIYIVFAKDIFIAYDVFKIVKKPVVDLGGIPIMAIVVLGTSIYFILGYISFNLVVGITLTLLIASLIGLIDDLKKDLPGWYKPASALLIGIPVILLRLYNPKLKFFGDIIFNIPIIYILLILIGFSVATNAVNMLDVVNGSASIGVAFIIILNIILSYFQGKNIIVGLIFLISTLSFLVFNIYPSRIFLGNVGAMLLGSMVAFISIYSGTEFLTVIAMYPFIVNGLFYLDKFRRFVERRVHGYKIAALNRDGLIEDMCEDGSPIVLLKYIVSVDPKSESTVILELTLLFLYSMTLSLIIFFLFW
ncbi:TPA: hypothetical protein EYP83_00090 [Candidatus Geothermarchaeota archaeon]|nr:hypothetical protein [Candidatus Geothermarchaeota archaeon]